MIVEARFKTRRACKNTILEKIHVYHADREAKGHYKYPSAGSVFKNSRELGKPTGRIIEELSLRGTQIGGARIADWHGNFIINMGEASAADIHALITLCQKKARDSLGIKLESEIVLLGF